MKPSYTYPFKYTNNSHGLSEGADYQKWVAHDFDLKQAVMNLEGPIVEIAGPTKDGFYFLEGIDLPSQPIITNISTKQPPFHSDDHQEIALVDQLVDATHMQYADSSLGLIFCSGLTIIEHSQDAEEERVRYENAILEFETEQVALGILKLEEVHYAQRLKFYSEVLRTLMPGGLFFMTGDALDIVILQKMGLELKALHQESVPMSHNNGINIVSDFVMQKSNS